MTAKTHYDNHLAAVYSWMTGDVHAPASVFFEWLTEQGLGQGNGRKAADLGSGNGVHTIALARAGYCVTAIDFNRLLLDELRSNTSGMQVEAVEDDMLFLERHVAAADLITCCGDSILHLKNRDEVAMLLNRCFTVLQPGGKLVVSFRDYSVPLMGTERFIPVKSDENRILTCVLDYEDEYVTVTDLLHSHTPQGWKQEISAYRKVRIAPPEMEKLLVTAGFTVLFQGPAGRMVTILAQKE